jgi:transposase-like protein
MDPATIFCPNLDCPAKGQTGKGHLGIHARQDKRFRCRQGRKTFTATKGTAFSRLRAPAETVARVVTLIAHGGPLQAIVAAVGFDARTVAAWLTRAGLHSQAGHAHLGQSPRELGQGQADESRVTKQGGSVWMARALRPPGYHDLLAYRAEIGVHLFPVEDMLVLRSRRDDRRRTPPLHRHGSGPAIRR